MTDEPTSFHQLLKAHRLAAGLTQEGLAERAQLSTRAISDLERGTKLAPHRDTVESLARALNLPVSELEQSVPRQRGPHGERPKAQFPFMPTSFIGRDVELSDVLEWLQQTETRLLTVTGPPGIGKTRLALAAAEQTLEMFSGGVVFVPLAAVRDASLVLPSLAHALGIQPADSGSIEQQVIDYLQPRHLLLVIDNFEHVIAAGEVLSRLLAACSQVKLLVTSRATLNVLGEIRFELGPLRVPAPGSTLGLDEFGHYPALSLFSERAKAANPGFEITQKNLAAVVGICQRLNGLPLAIELASARTNILSPHALLQRLERQLEVLTGGPRDLPERQQTMRSAIAWSYDLLTQRERLLFRQLAYFVGSFSVEAVESIVRLGVRATSSVLDDLASLVGKSLVLPTPTEASETRLTMLESIREFGMERLAESGELASTAARHCRYYVDLAERGYLEQMSDKQALRFHQLEQEQGNLRLAARWIIEQHDAAQAGRFGLSLWRFWERNRIGEGRDWLDAFLRMPEMAATNPYRCQLLFVAGRLAYRQADYASSEIHLQECLTLARDKHDDDFIASALTQLGHVNYALGNLERAEAQYAESLVLRRAEGDARTIGVTLHGLARVQRARGDYAGARALLQERLAYSRQIQDTVQLSVGLAGLGLVELLDGRPAQAETCYRESLTRSSEIDDQHVVATALIGLAFVALEHGTPQRATALIRESLAIAQATGRRQILALSLESFAAVLAATGDAQHSWQLAATVAAYRDRQLVPQDPSDRILLDRYLNAATAQLNYNERAALTQAGQEVSIEQALSEFEQWASTAPDGAEQSETVALDHGQRLARFENGTEAGTADG